MVLMRPFYVRELTRYPVGTRRLRYLLMAVLASLILNFEGQIAPVVPLLLSDLHMKLTTYGAIGAVAVAVGAISAAVGGRLADRWGRTILLVPIMFVTAILDYATVLVHTPVHLLIVRAALLFVEGAAISTTAGLVRDFSPRMGRATAFGFWTWGPVGANFLAAGIAAVTLPIFSSWRSQFVIIGTVALVVSVVISLYIADLAPQLRAQVISSEAELAAVEAAPAEQVQLGQARQLLANRQVLAHLGGITAWQVFYWTLQIFGPTITVQAFGYTESQAAAVASASWAINLVVLFAVGRISDRLQLRKPFILGGSIAGLVVMAFLIRLIGSGHASMGTLIAVNAVLGSALAVTYAPWMALFSENVEDIRPELQGTAWGLFGLSVRAMIVALLVVAPVITAANGGSWGRWLVIALVLNALLIPAMFLFGGAWRRVPSGANQPAAA
jgi:OPA family glycerol-3-phosphate transporter-like MFS transporter